LIALSFQTIERSKTHCWTFGHSVNSHQSA